MKTFMANSESMQREWWVVDATDKPIGRLAAAVAALLRGKHKVTFTPHIDSGDHVVIVNAAQVVLTGNNKADEKIYRHSGYPGGLKYTTRGEMLASKPERLVERTIKGMLPHTKLGRQMFKKLRVYAGPVHPHEAQGVKPREI